MRKTMLIKIVVLAPVVLATWFITSTIVGKVKAYAGSKSAQKKSASQEPITTTTRAPGPNDPAQANQGITKKVPNKAVLIMNPVQVQVQVRGRQVFVQGSADLRSVFRDKVYMGKLNVYSDGEEQPSIAIPYAEQAFAMDLSGMMKPTFSETLTLPPGKHRISLSVHTLQAGLGLEELRVAEQRPFAIGAEKTIEIH